MTTIDPIARITRTYAVEDLIDLVDGDGPFLSVIVPAPSEHADSDHRLSVQWRNARREIGFEWDVDRLDEIDAEIDRIDHADAEAFVVIQRADGTILVEEMGVGVDRAAVFVGDAPRLVEVLEHRQRTLPHLLVDTDRTGAVISAFDGGRIVASDNVEGDTEHIARSAPGGWSQRRYQQRAENTWEQNAGDVADAIVALADDVEPVLIAVCGDVRAKRLVSESLPPAISGLAVEVEAGDPDAIADEVLRLLADSYARMQRDVLDRLRAAGGVTDARSVDRALAEGRVSALLVAGRSEHADTAGRSIAAALRTSADVIVVPEVPELRDGVAALTRW